MTDYDYKSGHFSRSHMNVVMGNSCHNTNKLPNPSSSISCHPYNLPKSMMVTGTMILATKIPTKITAAIIIIIAKKIIASSN